MTGTVLAATVATELGRFTMLESDEQLVAAGFDEPEALYARLGAAAPLRVMPDLGRFSGAVRAYFAGDVHAIDTLPVHQPGGAFRQAAWKTMREIPAGQTLTYAQLADRAGNARAVRAAGSACAQNRVALVVPCHRVCSTGGGLGGYYFGLPAKRWLLGHERNAVGGLPLDEGADN